MGQSGPESNGNEGILDNPESSSITGALLSDTYVSHSRHSLVKEILPLCKNPAGVFYSPSRPSGYIYIYINLRVRKEPALIVATF